MRVRLTSQARNDLLQIWDYIDRSGSGERVADRVLRRLDTRIRQLADFPNRGVIRSDLDIDARMLVIERWVVFYRVLPNGISISRIIDGARDVSRISLPSDDDF